MPSSAAHLFFFGHAVRNCRAAGIRPSESDAAPAVQASFAVAVRSSSTPFIPLAEQGLAKQMCSAAADSWLLASGEPVSGGRSLSR